MHPYSTQYLATERAKDLREQAAAARPWDGSGQPRARPQARHAPLGLRRPSWR